jgi:hypothetical protein
MLDLQGLNMAWGGSYPITVYLGRWLFSIEIKNLSGSPCELSLWYGAYLIEWNR